MTEIFVALGDMWPEIRLILGSVLCLIGAGLCVVGTIGLLRFPDFFTRTHAASIIDTGGAGLLILGMMILPMAGFLVILKLALILVFIALTSPTGGHAIVNAAYIAGLRPILGDDDDSDAQNMEEGT